MMPSKVSQSQTNTFGKVIIIGLGLIGSSIARALIASEQVDTLVGIDADEQMSQDGLTLGVVHEIGGYDAATFSDADLIIIATPMGVVDSIAKQVLSLAATKTTITDVSSAKQSVVDAFQQANGGVVPNQLVPGHPIAGTEHNGVHAGFATLFDNKKVVITPLPQTNPSAIRRVRELWELCGACVSSMSVQHHDELFAATSHLPHMLAYTLVDALANQADKLEIFSYASGGFRDFTRIASSDPIMWRDIALLNKEAILDMIALYQQALSALANEIQTDNRDAIQQRFSRAKAARDALL